MMYPAQRSRRIGTSTEPTWCTSSSGGTLAWGQYRIDSPRGDRTWMWTPRHHLSRMTTRRRPSRDRYYCIYNTHSVRKRFNTHVAMPSGADETLCATGPLLLPVACASTHFTCNESPLVLLRKSRRFLPRKTTWRQSPSAQQTSSHKARTTLALTKPWSLVLPGSHRTARTGCNPCAGRDWPGSG